MKNIKAFYKKLDKLLTEDIPENCIVVFDEPSCSLYVIDKTKGYFYDNCSHVPNSSGSYAGGGCPVGVKNNNGELGWTLSSQIGNISIDMETVQKYRERDN